MKKIQKKKKTIEEKTDHEEEQDILHQSLISLDTHGKDLQIVSKVNFGISLTKCQ